MEAADSPLCCVSQLRFGGFWALDAFGRVCKLQSSIPLLLLPNLLLTPISFSAFQQRLWLRP